MKKDIILAGVGGQGILSIAATIGTAAVNLALFIKQAETHGMSQRGGDVQSHFRFSDQPIASDLIPLGQADLILSVEPMESLRYLPYLANDGWLITNTKPFINIPNYPDETLLIAEIKKIKNHIAIDAVEIAKELGNPKAANIVMLGAASEFIGIKFSELEKAIATIFARKGEEIITANLKALKAGREYADNYQK
ncbi:MAG: indolepyruvate oxidoreductase subunit beta [Bacteroidia bacterium]|jgi:indolepyruvate ferredoxin oxidoreductase beta subunit|nr:indolepyruvate oxidoreductase subunit beta [Bacteroidales bacterium]NCD42426.1 indolepyruvate oxidoreductase subunit beta [Bacteroidia bacterium]MDD2322712.1 indolepyruvate oxidoreductase subunit beta [Bacteroidales bacterium]MDD3010510.1 indolepyruvate oxidoreductase subunit beta [Bacteroidales bacterium]MDD3960325.1 indolepyruvate oxidoreductase subunit beta [Bacteroidales bacterium]